MSQEPRRKGLPPNYDVVEGHSVRYKAKTACETCSVIFERHSDANPRNKTIRVPCFGTKACKIKG
jgi:hypothetical protein